MEEDETDKAAGKNTQVRDRIIKTDREITTTEYKEAIDRLALCCKWKLKHLILNINPSKECH